MTQQTSADRRSSIGDAIELLRGDIAEVMRGISLIDAAADRGEAEALERKAVIEAMGCARPQNWETALDCLQEAAERGSNEAQRQMLILARVAPDGAHQPRDWATIRSAVSIANLAQPPPKRALSESPRLRVIEGFATDQECEWLIGRARDRLRRAVVVNSAGRTTVEAARTNSGVEFMVADMDLVIEAIRVRISAATRLPLPLFEPAQVLHYAPGQEFKPHHDYFDPKLRGHTEQIHEQGQRIATFLVYLNDDYSGGDTAFPRARISYRGKTGGALFVANVDRSGEPDPMTLHAGTPPIAGEKWILSQWIRDKVPVAPAIGTEAHQVPQR